MPITDFYGTPGVDADGNAQRSSTTENWTTVRSGVGDSANNNPDSSQLTQATHNTGTGRNTIIRSFWNIPTGAIGSGSTVTAATANMFVNSVETVNDPYLVMVLGTPASDAALAADDYENGFTLNAPTEYTARQEISVLTLSAYNVVALTNLAIISKTGYSHVGWRDATYDIDNVQPGGTASNQNNVCSISFSGHAGTSQDPYLEVTYSSAAVGGSHLLGLTGLGM